MLPALAVMNTIDNAVNRVVAEVRVDFLNERMQLSGR